MYGQEQAVTVSANITGDAVVASAPALYWGATMAAGSTNTSLILYDNATEASGTVIDRLVMDAATEAGDNSVTHLFAKPVSCANGIYADWTGTGAIGKVWYESK